MSDHQASRAELMQLFGERIESALGLLTYAPSRPFQLQEAMNYLKAKGAAASAASLTLDDFTEKTFLYRRLVAGESKDQPGAVYDSQIDAYFVPCGDNEKRQYYSLKREASK